MSVNQIAVLLALAASFGVFGARCWKRFRHMRMGRPSGPFGEWGARFRRLALFVGAQGRLFRFPWPGIAHFFIFWGFLTLVPTIVQAILEGLFPGFVLPFFSTWAPIVALQEIMAVVVAAAVLYGLYLRLIGKPERYEGSHKGEGVLVLCLIFTITTSLVLMNAARAELGHPIPPAVPLSGAVRAFFAGVGHRALEALDLVFYWLHLGAVLFFLTLLPAGKHFHVVTSIINVLLSRQEPRGRLPASFDLEGVPGIQRIEQFPWRSMLDWYSCTECGRCQDVCPAYASGMELSPKKFVMGLRAHLFERGAAMEKNGRGADDQALAGRLAGDVVTDRALWACTTCFACDQECPLFVEHVPPIVDLRRYLLGQQRADNQLMTALQSLRRYGNSFGQSDRKRAVWTKPFKNPKIKDVRKEKVRTLWFVGDYASYSPTLTAVTQTTARVFDRAGIDFGILYDGERNSGNDVRRVGEEGLYEMLAMKNKAAMFLEPEKTNFEEIVTTDPHSYNALKNEYFVEEIGVKPPIHHYAEVLDRALASGDLKVTRKLGVAVTYHDPCYLGRYNGIYDAPRRVLEAIGCRIVEMPRNRTRALCCGAGGGRIWMDEEEIEERPSESRIREAIGLPGVDTFVVACPKDLTMYADAVKTAGAEGRLHVKDLIELVDEATSGERISSDEAELVAAGAGTAKEADA